MTTDPGTIQDLLRSGRGQLAALPDVDPALEAEILLAHALERDRSWLYAWPDRTPTAAQAARFAELLAQRSAGTPIAHLTGHREFWSLDLAVSPDTLIPRPETELLVEWALTRLPAGGVAQVLELGTGSGAIALALARERPAWRITATDRVPAAVELARRNAGRLGLPGIRFLAGDWFAPLAATARFALILANPPYVARGDPHLARGDLRFEPRTALVSGAEGLDDLTRIVAGAAPRLSAGGWLLLEHGHAQGAAVRALLRAAGLHEVGTRLDLAGLERASGGRRPA